MSTVATTTEPLIRNYRRGSLSCRRKTKLLLKPNGLNFRLKPFSYNGGSLFCKFKCHKIKASSSMETAVVENSESSEVLFKKTFLLKRTQKVFFLDFLYSNHEEICIYACFCARLCIICVYMAYGCVG